MRRWSWGVVALLGACGVDLSYPAGARVICVDDGDCAGATKCSTSAGVCIATDDPDEAPAITLASATDTTHVVLLFSAPMQRETLARLATYALSPEIGVLAVDTADDGTRATLTTTTQRARPYLVTATALTDTMGRSLSPATTTFDGIGTPVDDTPPTTLAPTDQVRLLSRDIRFAWTQNADAATYTIEIARDPDFTQVVLARTQAEATLSTTLDDDDTYYWRVQSDIAVASPVSVFAVVASGLHVHCPRDADCAEDVEVFRGGDPRHPFRDPGFALAVAGSIGCSTVRIARRDEISPQDYLSSLVVLSTPLTVEGGYNATFTARDVSRPTTLNGATTARVANASGTVLSGLAFVGNVLSDEPLFEVISSTDVHIDDTLFFPGNSAASPLRVVAAVVLLEHATISGTGHGSIDVTDATLVVANAQIVGHGIQALRATIEIVDSDLTVRQDGDGVPTFAVAGSDNTVTISETTISGGVGDLASALISTTRGALSVSKSRLVIRPPGPCTGACQIFSVLDTVLTRLVVRDSYLAAASGEVSVISVNDLNQSPDILISGSTIAHLAGGSPIQVLTSASALRFDVVNSTLIAQTSPTPCIDTTVPSTLRNSAFIGCDQVLVGYPSVADVNGLASTTGGHIDGNIVPNLTLAALFPSRNGADGLLGTSDDDFAPIVGSALDDGGLVEVLCGSVSLPMDCPVSVTDIAGVGRGSAPAMGAWEAR